MERVNDPVLATIEIRCAVCGRGLGRWSVDELTPGLILAEPRPRPRGRSRLVAVAPGVWEEAGSVPIRAPRFDFAIGRRGEEHVLELTCSCRRGLTRRRVRIGARGLLRLLRRLGWPDVVEL